MVQEDRLEIIVLTRDRSFYLDKAVNAIESIKFNLPTKLIISNNSVEKSKYSFGNHWEVRNRNKNLTFNEHFTKVLSETKSSWVIITHDDDQLLPHFGTLFNKYYQDPHIRFISGISQIENQEISIESVNGYSNRLKKARLGSKSTFSCEDLLIKQFNVGSILPFSAVALRASIIPRLDLISINKYIYVNDFFFALNVCEQQNMLSDHVVFDTQKPVMKYTLHEGQISNKDDMSYKLPFETFMCCVEIYAKNSNRIKKKFFYKKLFKAIFTINLSIKHNISYFDKALEHWDNYNFKSLDLKIFRFIIFKISPNLPGIHTINRVFNKFYWKLKIISSNFNVNK
jgi:hypothetical protein